MKYWHNSLLRRSFNTGRSYWTGQKLLQDHLSKKLLKPSHLNASFLHTDHHKFETSFDNFLGQRIYSAGTDFTQWMTRTSIEFTSPLNNLMFDPNFQELLGNGLAHCLHTVKMLHARTLARAKQPFQQYFTPLPLWTWFNHSVILTGKLQQLIAVVLSLPAYHCCYSSL